MSEENKNLNEQPEVAPVEKKEEAPVEKKPLSKKQIGIIAGIAAAVVVLIVVLALVLGGGKDPHTHSFADGKCECGATDPNYVPPHTHSYVEGKCECGATDPNYVPSHTHSYVEGKCECGATDPNYVPDGPVVTEKEYKLGLGLVFGEISASQTNATIATVIVDENGVIVDCKIDAVQNKYSITESGVSFTVLQTKKELGDKYNMAAYGTPNWGTTVKEWYEQAAIFEQYVIGKTAEELKALEYQEVNGHFISKDEALLNAGCTIQIGEFVNAVVKACEDEQGMAFSTAGEITLGLGVNSTNDGSSGDDFEATVKMNIDFAAVATVDGKIVATLNDAAQPQLTVEDATTVISSSVGKGEGILKTKRELKEDYKMAAFGAPNVAGGTVKEWYIQSAAFSSYLVGKTPADVALLKTQLVNNHYISTDDALLTAGCTIQITGIQDVVLEAAGYAEYKLGLGLVFGEISASQTNATIATVILDKDGKIVACKIDAVQNKYSITENGVSFTVLETKKELGDRYNMAAYGTPNWGTSVKEWYEQAAIFEQYVIGKTVSELKALEYQEVNGHFISKDEALLNAGCTIQIGEFVNAVVKACEDDQGVSFRANGTLALGLGVNSTNDGSNGDDFEATVKMNIDYAATVVVDGKIVAALNDAAQPQLTVEDATTVISSSVGKGEGILKTKRELKEDYKMAAFGAPNVEGGTVKEWYIQSAAFSKYVVGLTSAEVEGLETQVVNNHHISTDEVLLNAGCTIQITGIQSVVVEAIANAD